MVNRKIIGLVIVIAVVGVGSGIGIYFIMTTPTDGTSSIFQVEWNQTWGGASNEDVRAMYLDPSEDIYLVGTTPTNDSTMRCFLKYNSSGILQGYNLSSGYISSIATEGLNSYITEEDCVFTGFGPICSTDLCKYNNSGGLLWNITSLNERSAIADSFGNVYLSVQRNYEVFMVKFNSTGDLQWNITWNSVNLIVGSVKIIDSVGNSYLAGQIDAGSGNFDIFLAKFNSTGDLQWEKTWGGSNTDRFNQYGIDSVDNIYLSGITFGVNDLYLIKYNTTGDLQWEYTWNAADTDDELTAIAFDSSNNVYLTGTRGPASYCDVTLVKINDQGSFQWIRSWGGNHHEEPVLIKFDSNNDVYIGGGTTSFGAGMYDIFFIKYNTTGDFEGDYIWGGTYMETLREVVLDTSDNIYLTGTTSSFGAGNRDIFLIKLVEDS